MTYDTWKTSEPFDVSDAPEVDPNDYAPRCARCSRYYAPVSVESLCAVCGDEAEQAAYEEDIPFGESPRAGLDLRLKAALVAQSEAA